MQARKITPADETAYPNSQKLTYKAPQDMPNCVDLETLTIDGCATSFWKPNQEELHMLREGGSIELTIFGGFMPPVALGVSIHG
jgi:hypothetical protein